MCLTKHAWNGTLKRNEKNPGNKKKKIKVSERKDYERRQTKEAQL
jgi:hypothetical protein